MGQGGIGSSAARLDEDILQDMVDLRASAALGDFGDLEDQVRAVKSDVLRRGYTYGDGVTAGDLTARLQELRGQLAAVNQRSASATTRVTAGQSGYFSSLVDGYEAVLTPERLETMTPADYRSLAPQQTAGSCGKMVYGTRWYFVTLMKTEDMGRMAAGDTVTLRFQNGLDRDLTMTVHSISEEDKGQKLVVLAADDYLGLTTLLRHQNAQIIFDSYTGLRVPRSAVRILTETITDEEGGELTEKTTGVYCLWGAAARFKPVEVIWQEESYILVRPAEGASSTRVLRAGDEAITAAADLFDGKVISK